MLRELREGDRLETKLQLKSILSADVVVALLIRQ